MFTRLIGKLLELNSSFFLFGARGTGKTFWLKKRLPEDAIVIDLLNTDDYISLQSKPSLLEQRIPNGFKSWVVIDEVQKIPELLNEVHRLIESKDIKFILTGSSARNLRKKGINLLAGRALSYKLYPLTAIELAEEWDLNYALNYGLLPSVYSKHKKQEKKYLQSYIQTYLKEEVLQEGLTRNLGAFARFMEIASFSQASVLNISQVATEAQISRKVVEGYFNLLEDLLIAYRIPVFSKKAKRKLVAHSKFYYFDAGVYRELRSTGPLDLETEINGVALETLVLQNIIAINEYYEMDYKVYYWRTKHGLEVDFVLYGPKGLIAIEVKSSSKVNDKDLKSLKHFKEDYEQAKLYCFYGGNEKLYINDIEVLPVSSLMQNLVELLN